MFKEVLQAKENMTKGNKGRVSQASNQRDKNNNNNNNIIINSSSGLLLLKTNYHRLSSLEQHIFIISLFLWVRVQGMAQLGLLLQVSPGCNPSVGGAVFSAGRLPGKECTTKLIRVLGRIHFLITVWQGPDSLQVVDWRPPADPRSHT